MIAGCCCSTASDYFETDGNLNVFFRKEYDIVGNSVPSMGGFVEKIATDVLNDEQESGDL